MRKYYSILILCMLMVNDSCHKRGGHEKAKVTYYTCQMHPFVRSDKPGACPVCGMALVKVETAEDSMAQHSSNSLMLDKEKQLLANIVVDTVRLESIGIETTVVGKVTPDGNRINTVTARVNGRIDRLFLRQEGEQVLSGQALYSIYSEELLADQNDYLSALQQHDKFPKQETTINELIKAGRNKLQLWGMTDQQIKNLERDKNASELLTFYSPYNGFVTQLMISEGAYVEIGKPLFQIADLASVWVEAQVYPNEIRWLNQSTSVSISIDAFPEKTFKGTLAFENPSLEENSKINLTRFQINNEGNVVKPGMMARVTIYHQQKNVVVVPKSALLIGSMKMVWIESSPGMYESRTVETGIESKKFAEVLSGLNEGDIVVTSGAYLLNSEFILKKGAVKAHNH